MLSDNNRHEGERRTRVTKIKIMWIVCFMSHMRVGISLFFFFFECFCHSFLFGKKSWQTSEAEERLLEWRSSEAEERGCSCWYLRNLWPCCRLRADLEKWKEKSEHIFHHLWCMGLSLVQGLTLIFWGLKQKCLSLFLSQLPLTIVKVCKSRRKAEWSSQDAAVIVQCSFSAHWPGSKHTWCLLLNLLRLEKSLHVVDVSKTLLAPDNCWTLCSSEWFHLSQIHPWASFLCMTPTPLCKLLVVVVGLCGVRGLWGALYTLEDLLRSTSSTPPSLPNPSTGLCLHLPCLLGQPFDRTRNSLDSWWESLALTLSQKVGCKFTTFFDKIVITQTPFCHPGTSCKSLLFQHLPTTAFPVSRSGPARRCGLFVLLFPVKSIFFPSSVLEKCSGL